MPDTLESNIDSLTRRFGDVSGAVSFFSKLVDDVRFYQWLLV